MTSTPCIRHRVELSEWFNTVVATEIPPVQGVKSETGRYFRLSNQRRVDLAVWCAVIRRVYSLDVGVELEREGVHVDLEGEGSPGR